MIAPPSEPDVREHPLVATPSEPNPREQPPSASPSEPTAREQSSVARLHRSPTDRVVFGVCGGLAESLQVDAGLVRLVFAIAALWGGAGLLLYVVLAIILPIDPYDDVAPFRTSLERTQLLTGVLLIVLGGLLLASNAGVARG
jgi:phage shock protein PspC (stress-responsive transcriptional regulator)